MIPDVYQWLLSQVISKRCMLTHLTITLCGRHPHHPHLQTRTSASLAQSYTPPGEGRTPPLRPTPAAWSLFCCLPWGSVLFCCLPWGSVHRGGSGTSFVRKRGPNMKGPFHWHCLAPRSREKGERRVCEYRTREVDGPIVLSLGNPLLESFCRPHSQPHGHPGASSDCPSWRKKAGFWLSLGHTGPEGGSHLQKGLNVMSRRCKWNSISVTYLIFKKFYF